MSHTIILVPGLGDDTKLLTFITRNWRNKYRLTIKAHKMHWHDRSLSFDKSLSLLLKVIDEEVSKCEKFSLIGTSAVNIIESFFRIFYTWSRFKFFHITV